MMASTSRNYFESMYESDPDPWNFATSSYEQRKYALTLAALPKEHFQNVFEPGCSIGVLTELFAPMSARLLATDIIPSALESAAIRLRPFENVVVERRSIPEEWPCEQFDLVVLSEIAYYFDAPTLGHIVDLAVNSTTPGSHIIAIHWRGETDYPLTGDDAHAVINENVRLSRVSHHVEEAFVLDLWVRVT
jgi:2-polyprenyl-3-methyl-5-hydroxy-6-metoxy-1,4-benzoquinol methylase